MLENQRTEEEEFRKFHSDYAASRRMFVTKIVTYMYLQCISVFTLTWMHVRSFLF